MKVIGDLSLSPLSSLLSFKLNCLSPAQVGKGVIAQLWWAPGVQGGTTHQVEQRKKEAGMWIVDFKSRQAAKIRLLKEKVTWIFFVMGIL